MTKPAQTADVSEGKHTPLPWRVFSQNGVLAIMPRDHDFEIVHWTGFDGSKYDDATNRANAALIVKAVNAYPRLEAMEKALEALTTACEQVYCNDETETHVGEMSPCEDDDACAAGVDGDDFRLTFGMIRRARAIITKAKTGGAT